MGAEAVVDGEASGSTAPASLSFLSHKEMYSTWQFVIRLSEQDEEETEEEEGKEEKVGKERRSAIYIQGQSMPPMPKTTNGICEQQKLYNFRLNGGSCSNFRIHNNLGVTAIVYLGQGTK